MMTPVAAARGGGGGIRFISSTLTKHSPPVPTQSPPLLRHQQFQPSLTQTITTSRRNVALLSLLSLLSPLSQPTPASAFSIGISGPKDWLRDQKKKASKFLLAPIDSSRESLRTAYLLLKENDSTDPSSDLIEVKKLLKSAVRDCVKADRDSIVSFQASTGVEVCTFRLIVNNAASLLDNKDPVKLEAEAMLADLLRSFTLLGGMTNAANFQLASSRQQVKDALTDAISSLDKFEQVIKDCLEA